MDLEKAKKLASGDAFHTETIAFRIDAEAKERLAAICKNNNLSIGRLMRAMVQEFNEGVK